MEVIFKWFILGMVVAGVAAAVRHLLQLNRERKERIAELERQREEWIAKANRNFVDRQARTAAARAGKRNQ